MCKIYLITEHQMQTMIDMLCAVNRTIFPPESSKLSRIINALGMLEYIKSDDRLCDAITVLNNLMRQSDE